MSEIAEQVGQLIREARKAKGLTQSELAEQLGISVSTVNKYEKDSQNLTINTLKKIASALKLKLNISLTE